MTMVGTRALQVALAAALVVVALPVGSTGASSAPPPGAPGAPGTQAGAPGTQAGVLPHANDVLDDGAGGAQEDPGVEGHGVYLGTDTTMFPPFDWAEGYGDRTNALSGWTWEWNRTGGWSRLFTVSTNVIGTIFAETEAHAGTKMGNQINILRRCADQDAALGASVEFGYRGFGRHFVDSFGRSWLQTWVSPDGTSETQTIDFRRGSGSGGITFNQSRSDTVDLNAIIGGTYNPYLRAQVHTKTWQPGGVARADYRDNDPGWRVNLYSIWMRWKDSTPPTVSVSRSAARSHNGWYSAPATVSIQARDRESCTREIRTRVNLGSWSSFSPGFEERARNVTVGGSNAAGTYRVDYEARNWRNLWRTGFANIQVDGIPPRSSATVDCERNLDGNCVRSATVRFSCTDNHSGCPNSNTWHRVNLGSWRQGSSVLVTSFGNNRVDYYGEDNVGNQESPFNTVTFRIECQVLPPALGTCIL